MEAIAKQPSLIEYERKAVSPAICAYSDKDIWEESSTTFKYLLRRVLREKRSRKIQSYSRWIIINSLITLDYRKLLKLSWYSDKVIWEESSTIFEYISRRVLREKRSQKI